MTAQLVDSKPQTQSEKIWNKPTARAEIGDYFRIPYTPVMQVVDKDELESGQVWLLLKPTTASYAEEWVLSPEAKQPPAPQAEPQRQSTGFSGDSVGCQLRMLEVAPIQPVTTPERPAEPTPKVESEFDQGRTHGQHDALQGWHPIHKKPATDYARGYLSGYNAGLNPISPQVEVSNPVEWTVSFDKKWHWYWVWVGEHCIGQASTYQDAERMATERIAKDEVIFAQNEAVMKAYSAEKIATPRSSVRKKSEVAQKYSEEFLHRSFALSSF